MAGKDRSLLESLAHLSTISQLLLTVGGLGFVAFGVQWVSATFLGLSPIERAVLAVLVFCLALGALLALLRRALRRNSVTNPSEVTAALPQEDTSNPYHTIQEHEIPHLLTSRWVQGRSLRIEHFIKQNALKLRKDVSVQLNHMTFVDCEIYGPAIVAPVVGPVGGKTFVDCSWDEDPWHRWRGVSKVGYYVGTIRLQDCVFRNCHFRGVGLVMDPDEYDEKMREFTNP